MVADSRVVFILTFIPNGIHLVIVHSNLRLYVYILRLPKMLTVSKWWTIYNTMHLINRKVLEIKLHCSQSGTHSCVDALTAILLPHIAVNTPLSKVFTAKLNA